MKITSFALSLCVFLNSWRSALGFVPIGNRGSNKKKKATQSQTAATTSVNRNLQTLSLLRTRFPPTRLNMASTSSSDDKIPSGPIVNVGLVGQLALNQAIVGSTIWTGGPGYETLTQYAHFGDAFFLALVGAAVLIGFSKIVETSESPLVSGLNLSTEMVVLRLFGPKRQPAVAFAVAAFLAGITGIVEETTFRGQILPLVTQWFTNNLGVEGDASVWVGASVTTLLFAILHTNPLSFFKGGETATDNLVLLAFQLVTGSIFMTLFLATQNLAVPIIAHALYDFYTFFNTHLLVTGQMEYAKQESKLPSTSVMGEVKWKAARGERFVQEARQTFYLMDTNQDGVLSRKELRIALFSYGINLSKMDSEMVAKIADLDKDGAISFGEFLEFVGPSGSTGKAVKNSLLGPV